MNIVPILIVIAVAATTAATIRMLIRRREKRPAAACAALAARGAAPAAAPKRPDPASDLRAEPAPLSGCGPEAVPASDTERAEDFKPVILVAEDNPSNYRLVEVLLRRDYRLLHAENGMEAVALFREHRPALILMDISMPEMDGYEALRRVRALDAKVPVIALTAYAFETDRQRMQECGFDCSLTKPLNARELKQTIRRKLGPEASQSGR